MNSWMKIIIGFAIIALLAFFFFNQRHTTKTASSSIVGCYVAQIDKNVYTLRIQGQNSATVTGILHYDNFQFDDSSGTFSGTFENNILLGDYSFTAEGMDSIRQLIWKRSDNDFIQGFGDYNTIDGREIFSDPTKIYWDPVYTYTNSSCT
jgi:hypothetical protein